MLIIIILAQMFFQMQKSLEITHYTVGDDFSKYKNEGFLKLDDPIVCFDYGLHSKYNEYYPEHAEDTFKFMGRPIQRLAFKVGDGIIYDVVLFLNVHDIDNFYYHLEEVYGKVQGARISNRYLQKYGYLTPPELEHSESNNIYKDLPPPGLLDYKDLNDVSWDGFDTNLPDKDVFLHVRNSKNHEKANDEFYLVEVEFSIYQTTEN